jgi:transcription-repair coupling factor (superfamily II helicase)
MTQTPRHVGEIVNVLALAHWLAHTPSVSDGDLFILLTTPTERRQLKTALQAFGVRSREWSGDRYAISHLFSGIVLCDRETIETHPLPSPHSFERASLTVAPGSTIDFATLKSFVSESGFERETTANLPGRFAVRGNIIDIHVDRPVRIECGQGRIDGMWSFDVGSGDMLQTETSITIPPLQLMGRSSLVDYIPQDFSVLVFHGEPLDSAHPQIVAEPLSADDNTGYRLSKSYHLRFEDVAADAQGQTVMVFTDDAERVSAILPDAQIHPGIGNVDGVAVDDTLLLTDKSLGLREEKQKKRSKRVNEAMILSLTPGDHVVHMFHGIARFSRMETMHVNDRDRDYFVLEYADGDKIYVPVELAERIDKYMGDPEPKLHRLSTASWSETVATIKKEAQEMAAELLDIYARREKAQAPSMTVQNDAQQRAENALDDACDFDLTDDQETALADVFDDMAKEVPMDRLLCGDVGFGKTEVAIRAALRAVLCGYQVAVLAPTTVLAQQHFDTFVDRLKESGVSVSVMSRLRSKKEQKETLAGILTGDIDVVIGTHRLLSKDVAFQRLGFVIIDEEQRFGVKAKDSLKKLRASTHILTMTATPIPRTLHLSLSGVRKISTILTPPTTRKAVETVIKQLDENIIRDAITHEMRRSGQTYYIYNRVESIEQRKQQLQKLLPKARIGVGHGQLNPSELARVMHDFDTGEIDVLLASTIVENGLDIPRANTLIVEDASKFGLAQLYQLKGRVGRSDIQGHAYFLYKEQRPDGDVKKRFVALQQAQALGAGFELAMRDMEIRGVGNILGKEQHGAAVKIGLHLYIRLLNQAMQELEGEEIQPERDIPIDLPLEARIPETAVPEQGERILLYQKLANIRDRDELNRRRKKMHSQDTFLLNGKLHPSLAGLFDLLEVKLLSAYSTLLSIDTMYPDDMNQLSSPRLTITADQDLPALPDAWEYVNHGDHADRRARAVIGDLGDNWPDALKRVIEQLQQRKEVTDESA